MRESLPAELDHHHTKIDISSGVRGIVVLHGAVTSAINRREL
jgi:hypothetical protein